LQTAIQSYRHSSSAQGALLDKSRRVNRRSFPTKTWRTRRDYSLMTAWRHWALSSYSRGAITCFPTVFRRLGRAVDGASWPVGWSSEWRGLAPFNGSGHRLRRTRPARPSVRSPPGTARARACLIATNYYLTKVSSWLDCRNALDQANASSSPERKRSRFGIFNFEVQES